MAGRHLVAAAVPSVVSRTMPPTAPRLCTTRAFSTNMQSPLSTTTILPTSQSLKILFRGAGVAKAEGVEMCKGVGGLRAAEKVSTLM